MTDKIEFNIDQESINLKIGLFDVSKTSILYIILISVNENFKYIKIGITENEPLARIKSFFDNFIPMGEITILSLIVMNKPRIYESLFKKENNDLLLKNIVHKTTSKPSKEVYPYNKEIAYRMKYFFDSIDQNLIQKIYINKNDSIMNYFELNKDLYKIKRNRDDSDSESNSEFDITHNKKKIDYDIDQEIKIKGRVYSGKILECPSIIPNNLLKNQNCAIFFNDSESNMFGWYKGIIIDVNVKRKKLNNCEIKIFDKDKTTFIQKMVISNENYGSDKYWILCK
jgi:hypothetical protein